MLQTKEKKIKDKTHQQLQKFGSDKRQDKYIVVIAQQKRREAVHFLMNIYNGDKKAIRAALIYITGKRTMSMARQDIDLAHEYMTRFQTTIKRMDSIGFSEGDKQAIMSSIKKNKKIITLQDINIMELLIINTNKMFSTISRTLGTWHCYLNNKEL